jgi:hypothetical protein
LIETAASDDADFCLCHLFKWHRLQSVIQCCGKKVKS